MRKIKAHKPISEISEELTGYLQTCTATIVFHEIKLVDQAGAADGEVSLVYLSTKTEYQPDVDVACLVHISPQSVRNLDAAFGDKLRKMLGLGLELWFWRDRFWIKGVDRMGTPWYQVIKGTRCHALYPIEVANADQLISHIWSDYGK